MTKFRNKINENKEIVIWVAIAALLALVTMFRYYSRLTSIQYFENAVTISKLKKA